MHRADDAEQHAYTASAPMRRPARRRVRGVVPARCRARSRPGSRRGPPDGQVERDQAARVGRRPPAPRRSPRAARRACWAALVSTWMTSSVAAGAPALAVVRTSPPSGAEPSTAYTSRPIRPSSAAPGSSYSMASIVSVRARTAARSVRAGWSVVDHADRHVPGVRLVQGADVGGDERGGQGQGAEQQAGGAGQPVAYPDLRRLVHQASLGGCLPSLWRFCGRKPLVRPLTSDR